MPPYLLEQADLAHVPPLFRMTVDQYHQLIEHGILPDGAPFELLDGVIVYKDRSQQGMAPMTHGTRHSSTLVRLQRCLERLSDDTWHIRVQLPITLNDSNEPEPDISIVLGAPERYEQHHPTPSDIAVVIEIADSSLSTDRKVKQEIYAANGIPTYWLVNLPANQLEVYTRPESLTPGYQELHTFHLLDEVPLLLDAARHWTIPISKFLKSL